MSMTSDQTKTITIFSDVIVITSPIYDSNRTKWTLETSDFKLLEYVREVREVHRKKQKAHKYMNVVIIILCNVMLSLRKGSLRTVQF